MTKFRKMTVTTPTEREIAVARVFDAPRRLVFDAMTKPELLRRWLSGPPGWEMVVCEFDLRVGGAYRYVWHGPQGAVMGMGGVLREIVAPERLIATEKFEEAWYPGEAIDTTVLVENGGQTTATITVRYESREIRDTVLKGPMAQGMAASYDNLEQLLNSL